MTSRILLSLCSVLFVGASFAQARVAPQVELESAFQEWQSAHGVGWSLIVHEDTGWAELLYGSSLEPSFRPTTDADFVMLARGYVDLTSSLHGLSSLSLVEDAALWLPLVGTTDKFTVRFLQEWDGVNVDGARLNVLMDTEGRLLSVHSTSLPDLDGLSTTPR